MKFFILFSLLSVCVFGRFVSRADNDILNRCGDGIQEFTDCVKYKTIKLLDRVIIDRKPIPLANFLYLTHENVVNGSENSILDEEEALKTGNVNDKLTEVLMRRVRKLVQTKNLQIKLDADTDIEQSEGRKKDKKDKGGQMMMMLGAGAMMMHAAMSKIALIAGKALIVAKIALVISSIIGLKKLFNQDDGGHHDSTQVIYKQAEAGGHGGGGGGGGGGWHRSIDGPDNMHAHQMAYGGQTHETT